MREELIYVCEHDLPMPCDSSTTRLQVFRVYANLVSHANRDGLAWVSSLTQAAETGLARRTVDNARELLQRAGRLERTNERKARGVIVWRVLVPEYVPTATEQPTATDASSRGSDRGSSRGSDRGSSRGSSRDEPAANGAAVDVQLGTEQNTNLNMNLGLQQLLERAADKCHDAWQRKTPDDTRPTPQAFLQDRRDVWAPIGERLQSQFPGAELRHLVPLLLDACGDQPLAHQLRLYYRQEAGEQRASRGDGTTTLGAAVEKVHRHLTPDTARSA